MRGVKVTTAMAVTTLAIAGAAPGAVSPKHGALYTGQGNTKKIALRVSPTGTRYLARLYCDRRGVGAIHGSIRHGAFSGHQNLGSTRLWAITGHFSSQKTAHIRIKVGALCDGNGGHLTLTRTG